MVQTMVNCKGVRMGRLTFFSWPFWLLILSTYALLGDCQTASPGCGELVRNKRGEWKADTATINAFNGDVQAIVDCVDLGGTLLFKTDVVELKETLVINQPIHIASGVVNGRGMPSVQWKCPGNKSAIKIQSEGVILHGLWFDGCLINAPGVIDILPGSNVTISTTKFSDNVNPAGAGCISANQSTLAVRNSSFLGNTGLSGGGIDVQDGSDLLLWMTEFGNNSAAKGGAVRAVDSAVDIQEGTFEGNGATERGGAVHVESFVEKAPLKIQNSLFTKNKVTGQPGEDPITTSGGAVSTDGDGVACTITNSEFDQNSAVGYGGALLFANSSDLVVSNSSFTKNSAFQGGAVQVETALTLPSNTTVRLTDSVFKDNWAKGGDGYEGFFPHGGGIIIADAIDFEMRDCVVSNNSAGSSGGGMVLLNVQSGTVKNSLFTENTGDIGGAIHAFETNKTTNLTFEGVTFKSNAATSGHGFGGAVILWMNASHVEFHNTVLENNTAANGGALSVHGHNGSCLVADSVFNSNTAENDGGALLGSQGASIFVENSTFTENKAFENGGAVVLWGSPIHTNFTVVESFFEGNAAPVGAGGALASMSGETTTCSILGGTKFVNNSAASGGGAIYAEVMNGLSSLTLDAVLFQDNRADTNSSGRGGAVFALLTDSEIKLNRTVFENNAAAVAGGLFVVGTDGQCSMSDSVFVNNTVTSNGGGAGFGMGGGNVAIQNTTFLGNKAEKTGGAVLWFGTSTPANLTVLASSFEGNVVANGTGGAMFLASANTSCLIGEGTTFTHNSARNGGALWFSAVSGFANLTIRDSFFGGNTAIEGEGGALGTNEQVASSLNNVTFTKNRARVGGALYVTDKGQKRVESCSFFGNHATKMGGAACFHHEVFNDFEFERVENQMVSISQSMFLNNTAGTLFEQHEKTPVVVSLSGKGGALAIVGAGTNVTLTDSVIRNNSASLGGGIYWEHGVYFLATQLIVELNQAALGGGLYAESSDIPFQTCSMSDIVFSRNMAQKGGGVFLTGVADPFENLATIHYGDLGRNVAIHDSTFANNVAVEQGGAVNVQHTAFYCEHCAYLENIAGLDEHVDIENGVNGGGGGAIGVGQNALVTITKSEVSGNVASRGGGVFVMNGVFRGVNVKLANNSASEGGGGIALKYGALVTSKNGDLMSCTDCEMTGNNAKIGGAIHVVMEEAHTETLAQCTNLDDSQAVTEMSQTGIFLLAQSCHSLPDLPGLLARRHITLQDTTLVDNQAVMSGNSLYTSDLGAVRWCCGSDCQSLEKNGKLDPCSGHPDGALVISGPVIGLPPTQADLMPKSIQGHMSGVPLPPVTITVRDSLGQVAYGNTSLVVRSDPPVILSGIPTSGLYLTGGQSTVAGITPRAPPGSYTLKFQFSSQLSSKNWISELKLEISGCGNGVFDPHSMSCLDYGQHAIQFDSVGSCVQSTTGDGKCTGVTSVPLEGFWKSMPQSGSVQKCLNRAACSFQNRNAQLGSTLVLAQEEGSNLTWKNATYQLCAKGYEGPLCGSCTADYGRVASLECAKCPGRTPTIIFVFMAFTFLFMVSGCLVRCTLNQTHKLESAQQELSETDQTPAQESQTSTLVENASPRNDKTPPISVSSSKNHWEIELGPLDTMPSLRDMVSSDASNVEDRGETGECSTGHGGGACRSPALGSLRSTEVLKILVNFLQVVGAAVAINAQWTQSVLKVLGIADLMSGVSNGTGLVSFECAFGSSYFPRSIHSFLAQIYIPFCVWIIFAAFWLLCKCTNSWDMNRIARRLTTGLLVVLYVSYINIARRVIAMHNCVNVDVSTDPQQAVKLLLWVEDTSVECYRGWHGVLVGIGTLLLLFVVVGYPVGLMLKLCRNKRQLNETRFAATYGFLYRAYKPVTSYWEVSVLVRKGLLAVIVVFSQVFGASQECTLAAIVLTVSLLLHTHFRPYDDSIPRLNMLESCSLAVSLAVYLMGSLFNENRGREGVLVVLSVVVILLVGGFVLSLLYELKLCWGQMLEEWLVEKHLPKNGKLVQDVRTAVVYHLKRVKQAIKGSKDRSNSAFQFE